MRIRRKSNGCMNCGHTLDSIYNYCPSCGQENNDNNISFGTLIKDFFTNYFAFDSKFARSVLPFFFKPGFLTNKYNEGKRVSYVHPVRLYFIVSLFFFFIFSLASKKVIEEQISNAKEIKNAIQLNSITGLDEETRKKISDALDSNTIDDINDDLENGNIEELVDLLDEKSKEKLLKVLDSTEVKQLNLNLKELTLNSLDTLNNQVDKWVNDPTIASLTKEKKTENNWNRIERLKENDDLSDAMIYDSLDLEDTSNFERYFWNQYIRTRRSDERLLTNYFLKNLPLMMLLLLPIFAFVLKVLYLRRKVLYIKHLIHALHLHSLAYIIYGTSILLMMYLFKDDDSTGWVSFITFVLVSTYSYVSFLKVYGQGWFKTLVKFNLLGFMYINLLGLSVVIEVFISGHDLE
ncbi:DUF3667 domain-containing protein [Fulvivirgaceae bacterium BMA10]|uniref:DUF3667 domain-containing protein n=1 Tax=Splendidivirga corallicola TaxID=3051826 RepID=A0ABT8KSK4_9BACT|nr:DUF3667 domain-containing protein [Fulvivirgaceae bacterium BMA10]